MATSAVEDLINANSEYATAHIPPPEVPVLFAEHPRGSLSAIVTCMDPRCTPENIFKYGDLGSPQPTSIRVVGGRAKEALSSLLQLHHLALLKRIVIVHHTDCGLTYISDEEFHEGFPQEEAKAIKVLSIKNFDESVSADVKWLKSLPYWGDQTAIVGMVYDIKTGKVRVVE